MFTSAKIFTVTELRTFVGRGVVEKLNDGVVETVEVGVTILVTVVVGCITVVLEVQP